MPDRWKGFWQDGKVTIAWIVILVAYVGFRIANINAPEITNAFVTITGIFVGTLGVQQSKKKAEETARVERKADEAVTIAGHAVEAATGPISVEAVRALTQDHDERVQDRAERQQDQKERRQDQVERKEQKPPRIARPEEGGSDDA